MYSGCGLKDINKKNNLVAVDLSGRIVNDKKNIMALQNRNLLDQIGGSFTFGKKQDLFVIVASVLVVGVVLIVSIFKKK